MAGLLPAADKHLPVQRGYSRQCFPVSEFGTAMVPPRARPKMVSRQCGADGGTREKRFLFFALCQRTQNSEKWWRDARTAASSGAGCDASNGSRWFFHLRQRHGNRRSLYDLGKRGCGNLQGGDAPAGCDETGVQIPVQRYDGWRRARRPFRDTPGVLPRPRYATRARRLSPRVGFHRTLCIPDRRPHFHARKPWRERCGTGDQGSRNHRNGRPRWRWSG